MKKIIICAVISLILLGCDQTNQRNKIETERKVQNAVQRKVEYWANFDDECDQKSECIVDTIVFRRVMHKIMPPEKILEYFGTGYHNFYLGLKITKDGITEYNLGPDLAYWLSPGNMIKDPIFDKDKLRKNNHRGKELRNKKSKPDGQIFYTSFNDEEKIFKAKPGIMNGRAVRTIKIYEISVYVKKDNKFVKPWSIKELDISKFRDHLLEKHVDKYWYSTGLPALSVDGFEEIRNSIVYPEEAVKNGVTGRVVVQIYADAKGNYAGYQLLKGLGYGCDDAVITAIKKVKFRAYPTGERSSIIVPFEFGTPKTNLLDLTVMLFDYNDNPEVYNNIRLGIVNKYALEKNVDQEYFVYVYIDNKLVFRSLCSGISKSEAQQFFWFRWQPEKSGTYEYNIYLDPENRLDETNRSNNIVRGSFTVRV